MEDKEVNDMAEDNVHERINDISTRLTRVETTQPMLQELMERNIASNERLGETLHEMQTSMALMNSKMDSQTDAFNERMDAQAEAFEGLKRDMEEAGRKTEEGFQAVNDRVQGIEDKGKFDIYDYIKSKLPWIIVLLGAGSLVLSEYFKF